MCVATDRYAKFLPYRSFTQRYRSFDGYGGLPSITALARAGFFFVHEDLDTVQCFYCGVQIYQWEATDDPVMEHLKYAPDCWFADTIKCVRDVERYLHEQKANHETTMKLNSYCGLSRDEVGCGRDEVGCRRDEVGCRRGEVGCRRDADLKNDLLLRMIKLVFYM